MNRDVGIGAGIAASILAILGMPLALNYSGLCLAEGRYLAEQELIGIGLRSEFQSYPPRVYPGFGAEVTKPIAYPSFEDFVSRNPNCCSLSRTAREEFSPALFHRLAGNFATFVRVQYRVEEAVPDVPETYISQIAITNCGHPWNGVRL
jgi:hypothetical protein